LDSIQVQALLEIVHEVPLVVQEALRVVQPRDGREGELGARERVHEVEVGLVVGGHEPAVRGADQGTATERGVREADAEAGPGRGAVERGGAGVVVGLTGIQQARGRVLDGNTDTAGSRIGSVP
jgi:hypothetical protein